LVWSLWKIAKFRIKFKWSAKEEIRVDKLCFVLYNCRVSYNNCCWTPQFKFNSRFWSYLPNKSGLYLPNFVIEHPVDIFVTSSVYIYHILYKGQIRYFRGPSEILGGLKKQSPCLPHLIWFECWSISETSLNKTSTILLWNSFVGHV